MYTTSKHLADFNIAGVRYWDAALVLSELKPGLSLKLVLESDNPADPNAVALFWNETKLGYVPRACNTLFAQLLRFGHADVLDCRVLRVDPTQETYEQIHVGIYITDKS